MGGINRRFRPLFVDVEVGTGGQAPTFDLLAKDCACGTIRITVAHEVVLVTLGSVVHGHSLPLMVMMCGLLVGDAHQLELWVDLTEHARVGRLLN